MARRKIIPLRDKAQHEADDLAGLTVLAYINWPKLEDAHKRSRLISDLRAEADGRKARTSRVDKFLHENGSRFSDGVQAGNFVLSACQLHAHGISPTYRNIAEVVRQYRRHEQIDPNPSGAERDTYLTTPHILNGHDALVAQFTHFRSVAHIWAAFVWASEEADEFNVDPAQLALGTFEATANLMGRAAAIASYASRVPRQGRDHGPLLDPARLWVSDLPKPLIPWRHIPNRMEPSLQKTLQAKAANNSMS